MRLQTDLKVAFALSVLASHTQRTPTPQTLVIVEQSCSCHAFHGARLPVQSDPAAVVCAVGNFQVLWGCTCGWGRKSRLGNDTWAGSEQTGPPFHYSQGQPKGKTQVVGVLMTHTHMHPTPKRGTCHPSIERQHTLCQAHFRIMLNICRTIMHNPQDPSSHFKVQ